MSNLLGMYGQNDGNAVPDHDYPSEEGWPVGFVPVPIHTVENHIDYVSFMITVLTSYSINLQSLLKGFESWC
ncbi:unnamed protein product [Haemonchus placei]|uniref:Ovule protein n=1 Tax=Haemonchus placei TaxID=6290 RepID=A0A0N4VYI5_HAEPC|nr:unnamed protein product [Haemonchus placei]